MQSFVNMANNFAIENQDDSESGSDEEDTSPEAEMANMTGALLEYGNSKLAYFLQHLIDEGIITKNNRAVKCKVFFETLQDERFSFYRPDLMLEALKQLGCLESVSRRAVVFAKFAFEFPGVECRCHSKRKVRNRACNAEDPSDRDVKREPKEVVYTTTVAASDVFEKIPDRKMVDDFIKHLVVEKVLTISERSVKKEHILDMLQKQEKRFKLTYEELHNGLKAFNYIKTESKRCIVFAHTNDQNGQKPTKQQKVPELKDPKVSKKKEQCSEPEIPEDSNNESSQEIENNLQVLLQMFIDEAGLCQQKKTIKKTVISELLATRTVQFSYNELVKELWAYGLLENANKCNIVFSDLVFTIPNLRSPVYQTPIAGNNVGNEKCEDTLMLRYRHILTFSRLINKNFIWSTKACIVCQMSFLAEMQLEEHLRKVHGDDFQIPDHIFKGNTTTQMFKMYQMGRGEVTDDVNFAIHNNYFLMLTLRKILYVSSNQFITAKWPYDRSLQVNAGEVFEFSLNRELFADTNENHSILLVFEDDIEYVEHYHVKNVKTPYHQIDNITESSQNFTNRSLNPMQMDPLQVARPSKEIVTLFNHNFVLDNLKFSDLTKQVCKNVRSFLAQDPKTRLNTGNYTEFFSYCIQIADCGVERDNMLYDRQQLIQSTPNGHYRIDLLADEKTELPPDLCEKDLITLRKVSIEGDYLEPPGDQAIVAIYKIASSHLLVEMMTTKVEIDPKALYNVRFKSGRITHRMEHQALKIVERQKLVKYLFPVDVPAQKQKEIEKFEWFNENISRNPEQLQAVESIVNGTAYPSPYIIFGPPGTGKTSTIVETICQLYKMVPASRILVTAQSNSACDELSARLLQALPSGAMYRIYAPYILRKMERVDSELQAISNLKTGNFGLPSWDELYAKRIVVCTLTTAGRLVLARVNKRHFTHVFIDECASATETAALVPIMGVITGKNRIYGNIVLAGDIQQLGPTVKSRFAVRLGYAKPLMERLMELRIYQKDPKTNSYNPNLITKLVRSFRSHPKIIEFSNDRFYDGDLIAKAHPELTDWALDWPFLPNGQFPVIFVPCVSETKCDEFSYSTYNEHQVMVVVNYVKQILCYGINDEKILASDIGIISPYKKQCQKIVQHLAQNEWSDIDVGTVEMFQGREKAVVIISTVRSGSNRVGFLDNPKRLNVTVTRAKALMIIIGDPYTLQNDPNWYDLLKYCSDNNGCVTNIQLGDRPESHDVNPKLAMSDFNFHYKLPMKNQMVFEEDFL